jgi:ABC-type lipoprotein release transport system permease subunit
MAVGSDVDGAGWRTLAPLPIRFSGMILTWQTGELALGALVAVGVVTATLPARRAAQLPPTEALRYEA